MTGSLGLILVAAGSSRRMGGIDKVWATLAGRPIVAHSLARFAPAADCTVLVVRQDHIDRARALSAGYPGVAVVAGGDERQASVAHGLAVLPPVDAVAVHDAARPLASTALLTRGRDALTNAPGAVPGIPVADTIKRIDDHSSVVETVDRNRLRAVQTPQLFHSGVLHEVHRGFSPDDLPATDDAALLERAGHRVIVFPGETTNIKITTAGDLALAEFLLAQGAGS